MTQPLTSRESPQACSCGSELFWESTRANGWWKALIDLSGDVVDTNLDELKSSAPPASVICADCGKRNPNPRKL